MQLIMVPNLSLDKREMAFFDSRDGFSLANVSASVPSLETMLRKVRAFLGEDEYLNPVAGKVADKFYLPMMRRRSNVPSVVNSPNWAYFSYLFADTSAVAVNGFTSRKQNGILAEAYVATMNQVCALPKPLITKFTAVPGLALRFPSITVVTYNAVSFSGTCQPHYYAPYWYQMNEFTAVPTKSPLFFAGQNSKDSTGDNIGSVNMNMTEYVGLLSTYQGRGMDMSSNYMSHDTSVGHDGLVYLKDDSFASGQDEILTLDTAFVYTGQQGVVLNFNNLVGVVPGTRPSISLKSLIRKHDL